MAIKAGALRRGQPTKSKVICPVDTGAGERLQRVAEKRKMLGASNGRQRKLQRDPRGGEGGEGDNTPGSQGEPGGNEMAPVSSEAKMSSRRISR